MSGAMSKRDKCPIVRFRPQVSSLDNYVRVDNTNNINTLFSSMIYEYVEHYTECPKSTRTSRCILNGLRHLNYNSTKNIIILFMRDEILLPILKINFNKSLKKSTY